MPLAPLAPGQKIFDHVLDEELGTGTYATVFSCTDLDGNQYAIKIANEAQDESLEHEYKVIRDLQFEGIPSVHSFGCHDGRYWFIMDLHGHNLETVLNMCDGKYPDKTVAIIASIVTRHLRHIHDGGWIHRDIKPANILIDSDGLKIIDLGMSSRQDVGEQKAPPGTPLFASSRAHSEEKPSRQDDFVSLFYTCLYFLKGDLPWRGVAEKTMTEMKKSIENFMRQPEIDKIEDLKT